MHAGTYPPRFKATESKSQTLEYGLIDSKKTYTVFMVGNAKEDPPGSDAYVLEPPPYQYAVTVMDNDIDLYNRVANVLYDVAERMRRLPDLDTQPYCITNDMTRARCKLLNIGGDAFNFEVELDPTSTDAAFQLVRKATLSLPKAQPQPSQPSTAHPHQFSHKGIVLLNHNRYESIEDVPERALKKPIENLYGLGALVPILGSNTLQIQGCKPEPLHRALSYLSFGEDPLPNNKIHIAIDYIPPLDRLIPQNAAAKEALDAYIKENDPEALLDEKDERPEFNPVAAMRAMPPLQYYVASNRIEMEHMLMSRYMCDSVQFVAEWEVIGKQCTAVSKDMVPAPLPASAAAAK